jgi:hypothetical protein
MFHGFDQGSEWIGATFFEILLDVSLGKGALGWGTSSHYTRIWRTPVSWDSGWSASPRVTRVTN